MVITSSFKRNIWCICCVVENIEADGIKEAEEGEGDYDDDDEYGFNPELHAYKPSAAQETGECEEFDGRLN